MHIKENLGYDTNIVTEKGARGITPRSPRNGQNERTSQQLRLLGRTSKTLVGIAEIST